MNDEDKLAPFEAAQEWADWNMNMMRECMEAERPDSLGDDTPSGPDPGAPGGGSEPKGAITAARLHRTAELLTGAGYRFHANEIHEAADELASLQARVVELEKEVASLETDVDEAEETIAEFKTENSDLAARVAELEEQLAP